MLIELADVFWLLLLTQTAAGGADAAAANPRSLTDSAAKHVHHPRRCAAACTHGVTKVGRAAAQHLTNTRRSRFVGFYPQAFAKEPPLAILWLTSPSKPAPEDPAVKRLNLLRADLVRLHP